MDVPHATEQMGSVVSVPNRAGNHKLLLQYEHLAAGNGRQASGAALPPVQNTIVEQPMP
jgi:hypothetical protein